MDQPGGERRAPARPGPHALREEIRIGLPDAGALRQGLLNERMPKRRLYGENPGPQNRNPTPGPGAEADAGAP